MVPTDKKEDKKVEETKVEETKAPEAKIVTPQNDKNIPVTEKPSVGLAAQAHPTQKFAVDAGKDSFYIVIRNVKHDGINYLKGIGLTKNHPAAGELVEKGHVMSRKEFTDEAIAAKGL